MVPDSANCANADRSSSETYWRGSAIADGKAATAADVKEQQYATKIKAAIWILKRGVEGRDPNEKLVSFLLVTGVSRL
jgi:hypothetical protein